MSLILEIESRGPRHLAALTPWRIVLEVLAAYGIRPAKPWDVVRVVPRHPDWSGPCRLAFTDESLLAPKLTPPQLVREIESKCRQRLPEYQIKVRPAIDPNLVSDRRSAARKRTPALKPGELHALLAHD